ncbi:ferritin-like metal-binding protein YciE [Mesorhizobium sp. J18]|nr:ferritin-like metal-binding protein YciE [Mesorhizobium sp. J18]
MADMNDRLDQWLRDAHAMETQAEAMLSAQAKRIESYPALGELVEQHLADTRSQRERLEVCLQRRSTSTSALKDTAGQATAFLQGVGGMMASDEIVKAIMASYAFEQMEIAAYRILITAAETAGDGETARVCQEIRREEEEMAALLMERIPEITQTYLARNEASLAEAKR